MRPTRCPHPAWTHTGRGEARCDRCGTRRFDAYGALRPPGPAPVVTPTWAARRAADWAAAHRVAQAMGRGRGRRRAAPVTPPGRGHGCQTSLMVFTLPSESSVMS
ncbi:DUF6255 family natural product biosynthesis protein [Streptomyces cinnamoneus]|uniref:Uncharacterized protein n=1 Tax=Streptomyces cinnamoneus TaxID=53446 RepID=A0A918WH99_STRCJ|nr:hypothetical protein GCM10010507_29270 [Streptomyces cinnamoneus]